MTLTCTLHDNLLAISYVLNERGLGTRLDKELVLTYRFHLLLGEDKLPKEELERDEEDNDQRVDHGGLGQLQSPEKCNHRQLDESVQVHLPRTNLRGVVCGCGLKRLADRIHA